VPRTGPNARWPVRAHRAGQVAVFATMLLLVLGFLFVRLSPATFLRLVDVYRSLPAAVVAVALVSGVIYFALDSLRLVLMDLLRPADRIRRRLLLAAVWLWLAASAGAAVLMLWYPAWMLFGTSP